MGLLDTARDDAEHILEGDDGFTVPVLITSPPEQRGAIAPNTEFGTLDTQDVDNQIRAFMGDHFTQYDPDQGAPQAALNAKLTLTLKTLLDKGIITDTVEINLTEWKIAWLDPTSGARRDFMVTRIHPSRSLFHIVIILGEIDIVP
jgi:hypothetical protein